MYRNVPLFPAVSLQLKLKFKAAVNVKVVLMRHQLKEEAIKWRRFSCCGGEVGNAADRRATKAAPSAPSAAKSDTARRLSTILQAISSLVVKKR